VKRLAAAALAAVSLFGLAVTASAQEDQRVVLTIGIPETFDTFNPIVGVEVADYEVWNLQYESPTEKAAADFATTPALAESWEASADGKSYTYTLREGLKWSDGQPLTAEDIAYTITRANEEEWLNYTTFTQNLEAKALDERTLEVTMVKPDPKLPGLGDVYVLPKHVWEKLDKGEVTKYSALEGVGSGPFTLSEVKRGQFWTLKSNPNYWGGQSPIDEVTFRVFNNADAMVAALKQGEIDAAHDMPNQSVEDLRVTEGIEVVVGQQGGFDEFALNGGAGEDDGFPKPPHPALLDQKVREAIAHAIDKQTLVDRVLVGLGTPATTISPSADPSWIPEIPEAEQFTFDLEMAKQILEDAGYKDTNGDGIREMPGGGDPINLVYAVNSESQSAPATAEFISGWLQEIGIGTTQKPMDENRLIEVIGRGEYDLFHWGWTPFVDPDPMLSYFVCDQVSADPEDPSNYYNDANWCDPEYDKLYAQQNVELDPAKRKQIVHDMLTRFYKSGVYDALWYEGDLQAYRTDRFQGWLKQPADIGPVLFSNTSPTYPNLTLVGGGGDGGGGLSTGAIIGIVAAAIAGAALILVFVRRRGTAEERE
jgi:peptide/nickel transport system substrate-binding protein